MARTVADFLLERLSAWGVRRIYGYPGDGINGLLGALNRAGDRFEFVQARHEEMAAFMACGHAKFTGEVGVCLATSGPGAIHLLNGLYDAKLDHQPVVAIVGQQARDGSGRQLPAGGRPQPACSRTSPRVRARGDGPGADPAPDRPRDADRGRRAHRDVRDRAQRRAGGRRGRGPAARARHDALGHRRRLPAAARRARRTRDLRRAAEILNAGERVAMLVGQGALHAGRRGRRGRRAARRRRGQGAARQGRAARRPAVGDRARSACSAPSRAGT